MTKLAADESFDVSAAATAFTTSFPVEPGHFNRPSRDTNSPGLGRASGEKDNAADRASGNTLGSFYSWLEEASDDSFCWLRKTLPTGNQLVS